MTVEVLSPINGAHATESAAKCALTGAEVHLALTGEPPRVDPDSSFGRVGPHEAQAAHERFLATEAAARLVPAVTVRDNIL